MKSDQRCWCTVASSNMQHAELTLKPSQRIVGSKLRLAVGFGAQLQRGCLAPTKAFLTS